MGRYITDRTQYYYNYYQMKKDTYKMNYYEKKMRMAELEKIYEPYGGEKEYYKNQILNWIKDEKKNKDELYNAEKKKQ
tara:strand:- start:1781 stop:2014 length:234 start_codon:yes stop_codon:yes gene_type:complete